MNDKPIDNASVMIRSSGSRMQELITFTSLRSIDSRIQEIITCISIERMTSRSSRSSCESFCTFFNLSATLFTGLRVHGLGFMVRLILTVQY